jgi:L-fuculose-phosphate aldolase
MGQAEQIIEEICIYSRLCYERGLVGAAGGNVSARIPGEDRIVITPSGVSLRDISRDKLIIADIEGEKVGGPEGYRPSKETGMHIELYKVRHDINAVIHVHPPFATAFSVKKMPIPMLTASAKLKLKKVPLVQYADPGSSQLARYVSECAMTVGNDVKALALESHGLLAFDKCLSDAFDVAELVEDTARIAFIASKIE